MVESELSFLVTETPPLDGLESVEIEQHYLSDGLEPIRIRRYDQERFEITKKLVISRDDWSRKDEKNIPLSAEEYAAFRPLSKRGLTKRRWYLPLDNGLKAELDIFEGPLAGLVMVEVEFPDEDRRAAFKPPDWFGQDISQEDWAVNDFLAGKTLAEMQPYIEGQKKA